MKFYVFSSFKFYILIPDKNHAKMEFISYVIIMRTYTVLLAELFHNKNFEPSDFIQCSHNLC